MNFLKNLLIKIYFNFIFLRQNYVFNNKIIDLEETLFFNIINSYGLKFKALKLIEERIENSSDTVLLDFNKNE
jgi:hypothetical protein